MMGLPPRWAVAALALSAIGLASPLFGPEHGLWFGDLVVYFPSLYAALPGPWDTSVQGGVPLWANPQAGVLYPPAFWLRGDLQAGLPWSLMFHTFVGALGAYAWVRTRATDGWAPLLAGLAYGLSGPTFSLILTPDKLAGQAMAPWALWGAARIGEGRGFVGVAGAIAVTWLGGSIEAAAWNAGLAGTWALWVGRDEGAGARAGALAAGRLREATRALGRTTLAVVLGTALAAPILVPFAAWLPHTDRAAGVSREAAEDRALEPVDLLAAASPNAFWGGDDLTYRVTDDGPTRKRWLRSPYLGITVLLLAAAGILGRGPGVAAAVALALLFASLSMGSATPLWGLLHRVPGLDAVRYPEKAFAAVVAPIAWLAARGLRPDRGLAVTALLLTTAPFWPLTSAFGRASEALGASALPLAALGVAAALASARKLSPPAFSAVACAAVAIDLWVAAWGSVPRTDTRDEPVPAAAKALLADATPGRTPRLWDDSGHRHGYPAGTSLTEFRTVLWEVLAPNVGARWGIGYVDGMRELRSARQAMFSAPLEKFPVGGRRALLRRAGTDYWLVWDQREALEIAREAGLRPVASAGEPLGVGLLAEPDPLPRLRWARSARVEPDEGAAATALSEVPDDVVVFVDGDPGVAAAIAGRGDTSAPGGRVARVDLAPGSGWFVADTDAEAPGFVVLIEGWAPGWRYRIDGGAWLDVARGDVLFVAAPVPAGRHRVELAYVPAGRAVGWLIALVAAVALVAVLTGRGRGRADAGAKIAAPTP